MVNEIIFNIYYNFNIDFSILGKAERIINLSANPFVALPKSSASNINILPGPADYKVPIANKYKTSIPAYSIGIHY